MMDGGNADTLGPRLIRRLEIVKHDVDCAQEDISRRQH
jgi:hypothetical protein